MANTVSALTPMPREEPSLGHLLSEHHGGVLSGKWLLVIMVICFLAGIAQAVAGVRALLEHVIDVTAFGSAVLVFVVGLGLFVRSVWLWRQSLGIYEGGFVIRRLTGTRTVRWSEIESARAVREYSSWGTRFFVEVTLRSGAMIVLSDALSGFEAQSSVIVNHAGLPG